MWKRVLLRGRSDRMQVSPCITPIFSPSLSFIPSPCAIPNQLTAEDVAQRVAPLMPSSFLFAGGGGSKGGGGKRSRADMNGSSENMRKLEAKIVGRSSSSSSDRSSSGGGGCRVVFMFIKSKPTTSQHSWRLACFNSLLVLQLYYSEGVRFWCAHAQASASDRSVKRTAATATAWACCCTRS
jgi:hypothetical protein